MIWLDDAYEPGVDDERLLARGLDEQLVIITNDGEFVRGITRIDRYLDHEAFRDHVERVENWL